MGNTITSDDEVPEFIETVEKYDTINNTANRDIASHVSKSIYNTHTEPRDIVIGVIHNGTNTSTPTNSSKQLMAEGHVSKNTVNGMMHNGTNTSIPMNSSKKKIAENSTVHKKGETKEALNTTDIYLNYKGETKEAPNKTDIYLNYDIHSPQSNSSPSPDPTNVTMAPVRTMDMSNVNISNMVTTTDVGNDRCSQGDDDCGDDDDDDEDYDDDDGHSDGKGTEETKKPSPASDLSSVNVSNIVTSTDVGNDCIEGYDCDGDEHSNDVKDAEAEFESQFQHKVDKYVADHTFDKRPFTPSEHHVCNQEYESDGATLHKTPCYSHMHHPHSEHHICNQEYEIAGATLHKIPCYSHMHHPHHPSNNGHWGDVDQRRPLRVHLFNNSNSEDYTPHTGFDHTVNVGFPVTSEHHHRKHKKLHLFTGSNHHLFKAYNTSKLSNLFNNANSEDYSPHTYVDHNPDANIPVDIIGTVLHHAPVGSLGTAINADVSITDAHHDRKHNQVHLFTGPILHLFKAYNTSELSLETKEKVKQILSDDKVTDSVSKHPINSNTLNSTVDTDHEAVLPLHDHHSYTTQFPNGDDEDRVAMPPLPEHHSYTPLPENNDGDQGLDQTENMHGYINDLANNPAVPSDISQDADDYHHNCNSEDSNNCH